MDVACRYRGCQAAPVHLSARLLPGNDDCAQHSQRKLADYLGEIKASGASSEGEIGKLLAMVRQECVATMLA